MTTARVLTIAAALGLGMQPADRSAVRVRLSDAAPLGADEIARALQAVKESVAGHALRITLGRGMGPEFLLDADAHIRFSRSRTNNAEVISEYGSPARYCDGSPMRGEMVVEYRREGDGWTMSTRASTPLEVGTPIFSLLSDAGVALADGGIFDDGRTRALTAPWSPPGQEKQDARGTQRLVIDIESLRPVRWEVSANAPPHAAGAPPVATLAYLLEYDSSIELRRPDGVTPPPTCVSR